MFHKSTPVIKGLQNRLVLPFIKSVIFGIQLGKPVTLSALHVRQRRTASDNRTDFFQIFFQLNFIVQVSAILFKNNDTL